MSTEPEDKEPRPSPAPPPVPEQHPVTGWIEARPIGDTRRNP